jgi:hypothetical protein
MEGDGCGLSDEGGWDGPSMRGGGQAVWKAPYLGQLLQLRATSGAPRLHSEDDHSKFVNTKNFIRL